MRTHLERKRIEEARLYKRICKTLNLTKAEKQYGLKSLKWAMTRFIKGTTERAKLLKARQEAEERIREIDRLI